MAHEIAHEMETEMEMFVWVVAGITALETLGKVVFLASGNLPPRTSLGEVIDVVFGVTLLMWAAAVLSA